MWIALSDGNVYRINWKKDSSASKGFQTVSKSARSMVVIPAAFDGAVQEAVIVGEYTKPSLLDIVGYQWDAKSGAQSKTLMSLSKAWSPAHVLEASADGQVLAASLNERLFLANATETRFTSIEQLEYKAYSFESPDIIASLDMKINARRKTSKNRQPDAGSVVDVILGGARGAIYLYNDAIARCDLYGKPGAKTEDVEVRKYHWHRKAVHAVKWSRDGNYMISGGSENALVIWQMDTMNRDYLPHLSDSVENIVVSADGASYAVHLDDNSTMILSTSELRPTAYISGIQSAVTNYTTPKDHLVKRFGGRPEQNKRPQIAAVRATEPSKLHVCVGTGRQGASTARPSAPLLQCVDLETFSSVAKQPLARTQITDTKLTSKGITVNEPLVTHVTFSGNGKWLASVDEWQPVGLDDILVESQEDIHLASKVIDNVHAGSGEQLVKERSEVFLKFWSVGGSEESMSLVSKINEPHSSNSPAPILDVAADPVSTCFATSGADGSVRLWRARPRLQNGVVAKDSTGKELVSWSCSSVIGVGSEVVSDTDVELVKGSTPQSKLAFSEDGSTIAVAFGAGSVSIIDVEGGTTVKTIEGLWSRKLHSIQMLSQYVIVLSDELRVYDIVSDELRYGINIPQDPECSDLLQLAVDNSSGHYAVSMPAANAASVGVFSPEEPEPLLVQDLPNRIVSLVTSPKTTGFIALDDAAQIWTITEGSDPAAVSTAQPLDELNLDAPIESTNGIILDASDDDDAMESGDEEALGATNGHVADEMDVDEEVPVGVISQQTLSDIFNAAPAFAAPSVEDMFYKVTGLLATKPLSSEDN